MAYLPNEQEVQQTTATDRDPTEGGPPIGKVLIVILFLAAVGLLAAAGVLQYNNRERLAQVLPAQSWPDGVVSTTDPTDPMLGQWEKVRLASEIAPRVRQFQTYAEDNPEIFGDDTGDLHRRVPTLVVRRARELNIRDHQLDTGRGVTRSEWNPPRGDSATEHLRDRFVTNTYSFDVNNVTREHIVRLALILEDEHPWITVERLQIQRNREAPDDQPGIDGWSATFGLQWWEERERGETDDVDEET